MSYKKIDTFSDWTKDEKDQFTVRVIKGLVIDDVRIVLPDLGKPARKKILLFKFFLFFWWGKFFIPYYSF